MIKKIFWFALFFLFIPSISYAAPRLLTFEETFSKNAGSVMLQDFLIDDNEYVSQISVPYGIRLVIPDDAPAIWDLDTTFLRFEGTAADKVYHIVTFENNGKTMYLTVNERFIPDAQLIVQKAKIRVYGEVSTFYLGLDVTGDNVPDYQATSPILVTDSYLSDNLAPYAPKNIHSIYDNSTLHLYWDHPFDPDVDTIIISKREDGNDTKVYETAAENPEYGDNTVSIGDKIYYDLQFYDGRNKSPITTYYITISSSSNSNSQVNRNGNISNGNINGGTGQSNENSSTCFCSCTPTECEPCCQYEHHFNDLPSLFWAHDYAEFLYRQGIFTGVVKNDVTLFEPERTINRAEIAKVAVKAFYVNFDTGLTENPYLDVSRFAWYAPYVEKVKQLGVVLSGGDYFYPDNLVTRGEALQVLLILGDFPVDSSGTTDRFSDVGSSNPYMKYIAYAYQKGVIKGYDDGTFKPYNYINRAEISKLITLLLNL